MHNFAFEKQQADVIYRDVCYMLCISKDLKILMFVFAFHVVMPATHPRNSLVPSCNQR